MTEGNEYPVLDRVDRLPREADPFGKNRLGEVMMQSGLLDPVTEYHPDPPGTLADPA
jgi:hypothetical protein